MNNVPVTIHPNNSPLDISLQKTFSNSIKIISKDLQPLIEIIDKIEDKDIQKEHLLKLINQKEKSINIIIAKTTNSFNMLHKTQQ